MKKFTFVLLGAAVCIAALAGCGKDEEAIAPTDVEEKVEIVIDATDSRVITDKDEIEQMVIEYGIPMEAESIGSIISAEIDASVFD